MQSKVPIKHRVRAKVALAMRTAAVAVSFGAWVAGVPAVLLFTAASFVQPPDQPRPPVPARGGGEEEGDDDD